MANQYSFLSWARKGIANSISSALNPTAARAEIKFNVVVNGQTVEQTVQLYGPQDVVGINPNMVVRTEPRNWITDFEPNYMSFIEFYEEDFPWRYTPKKQDGARLLPWIALIILKEDEFEADDRTRPLPSFKIKKDAAQLFPKFDQLWAWAHVHVNGQVTQAAHLDNLLRQNADMAYSRLLSPRKLKANTAYHAFVVPVFETGRLIGIGLNEQADDPSLLGKSSWDGKTPGTAFPYYHRWYFHTGEAGDFEYLLTLLEPRTADKSIGKRDMDVSEPNFGTTWTEADKTLGMEGALKSPLMSSDNWPPATPTVFQQQLQQKINLPEQLLAAGGTTPVVSVPFYGHKHILEKTVNITNTSQDKWLTELNRDPRNRASAGLGTKVVQTHQERLMDEAWKQVKNIKELNQLINFAQLAIKTADRIFVKNLAGLKPERAIGLTQYLHTKVKNSPTTVYKALKDSHLPAAAVSATFRRMLRPNGALMRRVQLTGNFSSDGLIAGLNDGVLTAAPPQPTPAESNQLEDTFGKNAASNLPDWLKNLLLNFGAWPFVLLFVLLLLLALFFGNIALALLMAALGVATYFLVNNLKRNLVVTENLAKADFSPESLDQVPPQPDFKIVESDTETPVATTSGNTFQRLFGGGTDSAEAARFRSALRDFYPILNQQPPPEPARIKLDLVSVQSKIYKAVEPHSAIPLRFLAYAKYRFDQPIRPDFWADVIVPVMDYPDFKEAMYRQLRDLGKEFMSPNINKIPPNTISILVTNPRFIESYMVGLNHEMARELLWREYPTDQRGSYFRQFWDVNGFVIPDPKLTEEQRTENLRDIPRIHTWSKRSVLGAHPNPTPTPPPPAPEEKVVLTIRSDLFKRYPNTVVFAQRAKWKNQAAKEREMDETLEIDFSKPYDDDIIKTPRFGADMLPDIKFFGFNLTVPQAKGTDTDPGWYFVIMERPGEPRFGMDEPPPDFNFAAPKALELWNDLNWGYLVTSKVNFEQLNVLDLNALKKPAVTATLPPGSDSDDIAQSNEDKQHIWAKDSADLAYILYQAPVKVAVHATEMLEGL